MKRKFGKVPPKADSSRSARNGHMVVLDYNWSVQNLNSTIYMLTLKATLFNDSPSPSKSTEDGVTINCEYMGNIVIGSNTDEGNPSSAQPSFIIGTFESYMTENEFFTMTYNSTYYNGMTSPDSVWLEFGPLVFF